jgi:hypothetical protein
MDFASAAAARALLEFLKVHHELDVRLVPDQTLASILSTLLHFTERVSDELDRRANL